MKLSNTEVNSTPWNHRLSSKKPGKAHLPTSCWSVRPQRPPKKHKLFSLLPVAHQNLMSRPYNCRHHTLDTRHREIQLILPRKLPRCVLSFHSTRRGHDCCREEKSRSYPSENTVSHDNDPLGRFVHECNSGLNTVWVVKCFLVGFKTPLQEQTHVCWCKSGQ